MNEWLDKKEASTEIGVSVKTLERLMNEGKISYYKNKENNAKVRFKKEDVLNFIESLKVDKGK